MRANRTTGWRRPPQTGTGRPLTSKSLGALREPSADVGTLRDRRFHAHAGPPPRGAVALQPRRAPGPCRLAEPHLLGF